MRPIQRSLEDGERIVCRAKPHWIIFLWPPLVLVAFFLASGSGFEVPARIFLGLTFLSAFVVAAVYLRSEFAVTNRRILGKLAIGCVPEYPEVRLIEARHVQFKHGLLGGLLGYGTVVVTDREGATYKFSCVPAQFYKHVQAREEVSRRVLQ